MLGEIRRNENHREVNGGMGEGGAMVPQPVPDGLDLKPPKIRTDSTI